MDYASLKTCAQTNKDLLGHVSDYLTDVASKIHKDLPAGALGELDITDRELVERVYHLNSYRSNNTNDINITPTRWSKGSNKIIVTPTYENWYIDDKKHRVDGPAVITWKDGIKMREDWYVDGKMHRIDGPAITTWLDGFKTYEGWFIDGKLHRIGGGPAVTYWRDGVKIQESWYTDGERIRTYNVHPGVSTNS